MPDLKNSGAEMSSQPASRLSIGEYLALDRKSENKHEYFRGAAFAMGGASRAHNAITLNIGGELRQAFRSRECVAFVSDMRVRIDFDQSYVYPDVVATCLSPQFEDEELDTLINPQLIIEVLSDSTESYDRGKKFERYRTIESLTDYLLVTQDRVSVDYFHRDDDGLWKLRAYNSLSDVVQLDSVGCELSLADVYLKVEFSETS